MFSSISATNNVLLLSYTNDGVLSYCESNQREKSLCESSECMVTRLPRFWEGRNVKKGGDFIGVGIVFLDEKSHLTQGTQLQNDHPQLHPRVHLKLHYIQLHVPVKFFLLFTKVQRCIRDY
ncbi:Uncharacterized protein Rs2_40452 [Raphanus sativus]|nr:Uncharacterized protein Rs2_40452 [Raphanus sativus]